MCQRKTMYRKHAREVREYIGDVKRIVLEMWECMPPETNLKMSERTILYVERAVSLFISFAISKLYDLKNETHFPKLNYNDLIC